MFNERLTIEGIAPAPLTPEPDEAEQAAEALLASYAGFNVQSSMFKPQLRKPAKGSSEYYQQLAEKIKAAHDQEHRAAMRFVAFAEQTLAHKTHSSHSSQELAELERGLFKWQDAVEREQGDLLKRWQHCLADITVLQMQAVADGEVKAAIEREENDARISYPEREQARPQVKSEKLKV